MSHDLTPHAGLTLGELLPGAQIVGDANVRPRGCTDDSRRCKPGDIFVALPGTHTDGTAHIDEAIARGVVAVVSAQNLSLSVPVCVVSDPHEAYATISQSLAGNPGRELRVIGVTGTNGKTTTVHLIASILAEAGMRTGLLGTLGYFDSHEFAEAAHTTPPAGELAHWLRRMVDNGCSHAVMEVSSHAVVQRRIAGVGFAQICLTNLRHDHLDYHGTLQAYHEAKIRLFAELAPGGVAVINADDAAARASAPLIPGGVLTFGRNTPADISATLLERYKSEQTILLTAGEITVPVRTAMIGDHHIDNCLAATAVCLAEGIELTAIVRGLEAVTRVPGRLERIECGQTFGVFVDFAHTSDALTLSMATLREVTPGRLLCVFGAGGNRDARKRPLMGRAVEKGADVVIVTNDNPRFEDPQTIAADILSGCQRPQDARWVPDRAEAIRYALSLAGPDDCVLVAGRGHESHQTILDQQIPLDDCELVRNYLYNLEPTSQYGALMSVANS